MKRSKHDRSDHTLPKKAQKALDALSNYKAPEKSLETKRKDHLRTARDDHKSLSGRARKFRVSGRILHLNRRKTVQVTARCRAEAKKQMRDCIDGIVKDIRIE